MRQPGRIGSTRPLEAERQGTPASLRDRLAVLVALLTVVCVGAAFSLAKDTKFLMPGPLASAHAAIENCNACHTKSGSGKLGWLHGLVAGDRVADSKACLTCHQMPNTAFNAHGASTAVLEQSTKELAKVAARTPVPRSARVQSIVFPTDDMAAHGLYCATCHQEHQGVNFNLSKISNEQCRSCHVVKFDSFDGNHPQFENYPFKRRTQIIYDHASHFGKHFPEAAKKDAARRVPETCSSCHNSREDRRVMAVAPFEQTCSTCHLDQIVGKERASGPKGIAFLTLPGLDVQTLRKKRAAIGEWPDASEAGLTPFMKVMISRNERGRALIKTLDGLNLQDLSGANDAQIRAVTSLVWEIKRLFYALIKGKASDVLADLNIGSSPKQSATLIADLTASIPRDVIVGAQQQWLPNLGSEMVNRPVAGSGSPQAQSGSDGQANAKRGQQTLGGEVPQAKGASGKADAAKVKPDGGNETISADRARSPPADSGKPSGSDVRRATPSPEAADGPAPGKPRPNPQACIIAAFGQCLVSQGPQGPAAKPEGAARQSETANPNADNEKPSLEALPRKMQAGLQEVAQAAQPGGGAGRAKAADERLPAKPADQTDDLLNLTEDEQRTLGPSSKGGEKVTRPEGGGRKGDSANSKSKPEGAPSADAAKTDANAPAEAPASSGTAAAKRQTWAAPAISIQTDHDPEAWAEYGGWYRQDYAISYRPTGHKDKFIYTWLLLTGPQAPKGDRGPAATVFDSLTGKDAQGSCTKCHSVDDIPGKGRIVNFSPPSVKSKLGRFTNFVHEPHFRVLDNRGCLTCHNLEKDRPYLKSYEQGDPRTFMSNFGTVKKDLCQACHTSSMARQDCLLCHKYHVNGVIKPIMSTKIPIE
jgi:hypothetical protein